MDEVLKGIRAAIKAERNAQEHYRKLAEKTDDPKAKSMFEQMIRDEEEHEKILRYRYEAMKNLMQEDNNAK